jgi:hypothetical protein
MARLRSCTSLCQSGYLHLSGRRNSGRSSSKLVAGQQGCQKPRVRGNPAHGAAVSYLATESWELARVRPDCFAPECRIHAGMSQSMPRTNYMAWKKEKRGGIRGPPRRGATSSWGQPHPPHPAGLVAAREEIRAGALPAAADPNLSQGCHSIRALVPVEAPSGDRARLATRIGSLVGSGRLRLTAQENGDGSARASADRAGVSCRARGFGLERWWRWEELNLRHGAYETPALPLSYTAVRSKIRNLAKGFYRTGSDCARDCAQGSHRASALPWPGCSVPAGRRGGTHPASKSRPTARPKRWPRPKPRTKARRVT